MTKKYSAFTVKSPPLVADSVVGLDSAAVPSGQKNISIPLSNFALLGVDNPTGDFTLGSGKIGVGTPSPDGKLHVHTASAGAITAAVAADDLVVENNGDGGINILVPDTADSNIFFGSPSSNTGALIRWEFNDLLMTIGSVQASSDLRFFAANSEKVRIKSSGDFGIGTSSPDRMLHVEDITALTNTVQPVTRISHTTSATPANGIGVGMEFEVETSSSNNEVGATIEAVTTDVTAASEDFALTFNTMTAGATATEKMRIGENVTIKVNMVFDDAINTQFGTTTGTKLGTATTQKLSFWNAAPVVQQAHIADPTGGATVDAEARTAINSILAQLATTGMQAAS